MTTKAKHTPGSRSWIRGGVRYLNKNIDYDAFWCPDKGEDREAANVPDVRLNPADADLIAAAPELLAALKATLVVLDASIVRLRSVDHFLGFATDAEANADVARAAIAKAEGDES